MTPEAPKLTAGDRYRRKLVAALTPEQRLQRMEELHQIAMATLAQNPEAMEQFWRRNLHQRAARARQSRA